MVKQITNANFEADVTKQKGTVVLDFYAEWCGPCRQMAPHFADAARAQSATAFGKVDVDQERELAIKHGITSLPTMVIYYDGKPLDALSGFMTKSEILEAIEHVLKANSQ